MADESYAPRSPDLASFFSTSTTSPPKNQTWSTLPPRAHGQPGQESRPFEQPNLQLQPAQYYPPAGHPVSPISPYAQPPPQQQPHQHQFYSHAPQPAAHQSPTRNIYGAPLQPQQYFQPAVNAPYQDPASSSFPGPGLSYYKAQLPPTGVPPSLSLQPEASQLQPPLELDTAMPPRRSAGQAAAAAIAATAAAEAAPPPQLAAPVIAPSPVRTKFPTARIKRIMQADDEVGKVAQQTPIAVGKALELFMIALVTKSADVAREKNSKRVTAQMLKHVVESDDQWDFLRDIVGKVAESEEKGGKGGSSSRGAKAESDSDEEAAGEKRKGKAGRKKKS